MKTLMQHSAGYLEEILGIHVKPEKWKGCTSLPVFIQAMYDCYDVQIFNECCLLLVNRGDAAVTPANIRKHVELAGRNWHGLVVYVGSALASYDRRRLIQYKVPFLVPGNQLYLPDVGIDLREHFRGIRSEVKPFSPATQVVVLRAIIDRDYGPLSSTQLSHKLGYTPMTIKRAIDEIEAANLGVVSMMGRDRTVEFEPRDYQLWEGALAYLRNPVQRRVVAVMPSGMAPGLESGLTALSRYSMIAAPPMPTVAVSAEDWKDVKANPDVRILDHEDEDASEVEIWRYDPRLLSVGRTVDRLSLFLSLRESRDERIEAASEEMMEGVQW
jgi:DNA-binding MarR family transcriptional regulator